MQYYFRGIISPYSPWLQVWNAVVGIFVIFTVIEIPSRLVFHYPEYPWIYHTINAAYFVFFMDILVRFRTGFISKGELIDDSSVIASKYIRFWFWLDVLAAFPFDRIIFLMDSDISTITTLMKLARLPMLIRLFRLMQTIRSLQQFFVLNYSVLRLTVFVFWIALLAHWIALGWIFLHNNGQFTEDPVTHYIWALYWTVTTLTTVGYGDITPQTNLQRIYAMITMFLGVGVYGYVIGNIASLLANMDVARAHYRERINRVATFFRFRNLPVTLKKRIYAYYNYLWESRLGYDEIDILSELPLSLRAEVSIHINKDIINKVPLFAGAADDLLKDIILALKPVIALPGDIVFKAGDIGEEMYFISRGDVEILAGTEHIAFLSSGSFFGEIALVKSVPRTATVRAKTYTDLYVLKKEAFDKILSKYPEFAREIRMQADERYGENQKRERDHQLSEPHF